jgi:hypothetical protein
LIEFTPWPKIPRLNRDITVTEKIDGTNAAIGITDDEVIYAQSRKRLITPAADNFGFAAWVEQNAMALIATLGPGLHFGEWWGSGIQRGYGLTKGEKRFSLFNTGRWHGVAFDSVPGLGVVPVLYEGPFKREDILPPWEDALDDLLKFGSKAAPGFGNPEGVVVYHHAANLMFKVTLEGDEAPKSDRS